MLGMHDFSVAKLLILSHMLKFIIDFFRFSHAKGLSLHEKGRLCRLNYMILDHISIVNYKNILSANLQLSPNMNCLLGKNGMGKTNFLDAVHFLSFCRSANSALDSQVISHGLDFFMLEGCYIRENGDEDIVYCGMKRGQKKHFKRNKKEYKRLSEHIGLIPLVSVSPADASIIDGGSEERRKLIDMVISQYDNSYMGMLNNYNKVLHQRNVLLKMEEEPDMALMEILETQMAAEGEKIYAKRQDFIKDFVPVFQLYYNRICSSGETVSVDYVSHCQRGPLLDVIQRDRFKDRVLGYSLHGIHRDDLDLRLDGYPLKKEGSQGQTKSFAIALKLAQFDFLKRANSHTKPILLLDDIFDKLDAGRVEQIVKMVAGDDFGQIFVTDTNRDHLDQILQHYSFDYRIFSVENGEINAK